MGKLCDATRLDHSFFGHFLPQRISTYLIIVLKALFTVVNLGLSGAIKGYGIISLQLGLMA
jgi:hypothetical protein